MASEPQNGPVQADVPLPTEPLGPARVFSEELSRIQQLEKDETEEKALSPQEMIPQALFGAWASRLQHRNANSPNSSFLSRVARLVVARIQSYPVTLVHVLIQLGYEPVPPDRRYSIVFQRYRYYYPGIFGYAWALIRQDGWRALYRGFGVHLTEQIVRLAAYRIFAPIVAQAVTKLSLSVVENGSDTPEKKENVKTTRAVVLQGVRKFIRGVLTSSIVTLVSHPFHVMYIRSIAQHIGREQIYTSVLQSIKEIYREEGIAGFYSGIVPALLGSVYTLGVAVILWTAFELIPHSTPNQWGVKQIIKALIGIPLFAYSYPLQLTSKVMAVNNCRLAAGMPPRMPVFNGWLHCHRYLQSSNLSFRGYIILLPRLYKVPPIAASQ